MGLEKLRAENSAYYLFKKALAKREVPHFDSNEFFRRNWSTHDELHAPYSAHWSYYGAWMVLTNTIPIINKQQISGVVLPAPKVKSLLERPAGGMDDELRPQLNLPSYCEDFSKRLIAEYPQAYIDNMAFTNGSTKASSEKLNALVIGDSYGFGLCDAIRRQPLFDRLTYWYYCRTTYLVNGPADYSKKQWSYASFDNKGIMHKDKAYDTYCKDSDVVFLVMTTFNIDKFGWNFYDQVLH